MSVDSPDESHPQLDMDESYELSVTADGATLHAKTVWGALRGLETFSQVIVRSSIDGAHLADVQLVEDAP